MMGARSLARWVIAGLALTVLTPGPATAGREASRPSSSTGQGVAWLHVLAGDPLAPCALASEPPPYYAFPLVTTRRVPGTGQARGVGHVTFAASPFGVSLTADGSYELEVTLSFDRLRAPETGSYVVWLTTPELDHVTRAGIVDDAEPFSTRVRWNKFLVVVTLEAEPDPSATSWTGPIVIRGMSRSGLMHTMAGHGPFEKENCAQYGY